jgi:competence protein ComFC
LLWPEFCLCCDRYGTLLCNRCFTMLAFLPLPVKISLENAALDQLHSAVEYDENTKKIVHALKFQGIEAAGELCAELIFQTMFLPECDLIIPVPLHPKRQKTRGYNQAALIAEHLAKLYRKTYCLAISRQINTSAQARSKSREDRLANMSNAFALAIPPSIIQGKICLVVDDVTTTGATLNECAKVLKAHGATQVIGITLAHGA